MLRLIFAGALFIHGVGHILGFWMPTYSRLFSTLNESVARVISSIFWILSALGFLAAMLGYLGVLIPSDWWQPLSIATVCISLIGLALFGNNWAPVNSIGALTMNLAILTVVIFRMVI